MGVGDQLVVRPVDIHSLAAQDLRDRHVYLWYYMKLSLKAGKGESMSTDHLC